MEPAAPPDGQPISDPVLVLAVASAIKAAGSFALDLEFMTDGRYVAELSLVQVAWGDADAPEVAAIDPLAVDPRPVLDLAGHEDIETVLHSGQADLALLGQQFGVRARRVVDTQVAAAFLGLGDQVGYAPLVERLLGLAIDKAAQYTEWSRRPLSAEQIAYALEDVRHLPALWRHLQDELRGRDRLEWVHDECERLAESWAYRTPPEEMYRRIRGWNGLRRRSQGALRALAAWREREALATNRPPAWIMADRTMLELCRRPPTDRSGLQGVRGLPAGTVQRYGSEILAAIREGLEDPPEPEPRPPRAHSNGHAWPAIIGGIVQAGCRQADVAARFVATRADIDALISWWHSGDHSAEPDLPLLRGWRRQLAGQAVLDWLHGRTTLAVDPASDAGVRIVSNGRH